MLVFRRLFGIPHRVVVTFEMEDLASIDLVKDRENTEKDLRDWLLDFVFLC